MGLEEVHALNSSSLFKKNSYSERSLERNLFYVRAGSKQIHRVIISALSPKYETSHHKPWGNFLWRPSANADMLSRWTSIQCWNKTDPGLKTFTQNQDDTTFPCSCNVGHFFRVNYHPLLQYKAMFVKSEYFEPRCCSYGPSTTVLMTNLLSFMFFDTRLSTGTCWQLATSFFHTLINMKMLWRMKDSVPWLHTEVACVSSATPISTKNRFWHRLLSRYVTPQGLQTRWSLRKSLNRLTLFVIISEIHIFGGRESNFALKCSSAYFVRKMFPHTIVWKSENLLNSYIINWPLRRHCVPYFPSG